MVLICSTIPFIFFPLISFFYLHFLSKSVFFAWSYFYFLLSFTIQIGFKRCIIPGSHFLIFFNILPLLHLVKCGPGNFFNSSTLVCEDCPVGTYQNQDDQTSCTPCPQGSTTQTVASPSSSDCKGTPYQTIQILYLYKTHLLFCSFWNLSILHWKSIKHVHFKFLKFVLC